MKPTEKKSKFDGVEAMKKEDRIQLFGLLKVAVNTLKKYNINREGLDCVIGEMNKALCYLGQTQMNLF